MTTITYKLETLTCPSCMAKIEGALKKTKGVKRVEVMFNSSKAKVDFDESIVESEDIKLVIEGLGYKVLGEK
ncbi:heavy-metal-associated domain-containing protein [Clostridium sp. Cult2]|uniref:heavy-metal-associated domain-containing protein n=1 Tax=Clostridium sp. Cult2 TaxID=2079003 RepID=UPI001F1A24A5|nr:heavy-metal-associated domain-containing protein [Clostridium sp. Cult2]MCF6466004.1 heavy metal-binding protein [Clostridium sp. Cult2]